MNPGEWLLRAATVHPDAPALFTGERLEADYAEFARRAAAIGTALHECYGISRGDRVAVFMSNRIQYLEVLYGIWFCGAAAVPINARLHPREAQTILDDCGATLLFVSPDTDKALAEYPVAREDAILYAAPMSHGAGLYNFMHVINAARHVCPVSGGFDAA